MSDSKLTLSLKSKALDYSSLMNILINKQTKAPDTAGVCFCYMRVCAPPFLYPCFYGTDIDSKENLVACQHTVPEISEIIGADSLAFFSVEMLGLLAEGHNYCSACFDGCYPTGIPVNTGKNRFEQRLSESWIS